MKYHKNHSKKERSIIEVLLIGLAGAWIVTLIMSSIIALLLVNDRVDQGGIAYYCIATIIVASVLAAIIPAKLAGEGKRLLCLGSGALYYVSLLSCNAIFFAGEYHGFFKTMLTIMGCATVIMLLSMRKKKQKSAYPRKWRNP